MNENSITPHTKTTTNTRDYIGMFYKEYIRFMFLVYCLLVHESQVSNETKQMFWERNDNQIVRIIVKSPFEAKQKEQ